MSNILKNIGKLFYKKKYRDGHCIIRILFFRFKIKQQQCQCQYVVNNEIPNVLVTGKGMEKIDLYFPKMDNLGRNSYSAKDLKIFCKDTSIGSFCSIGMEVVLGHGEHPQNYLSTSPYFYFSNIKWKLEDMVSHNEYWDSEPIKIGNDVWIGDGVFVKNGVTIGDGAIIGAKAVVTKDVPPYAIVAGVPAKIIRYRFSDEIIKDLLELKWWDLDDKIIKQIPYDNIENAVKFLKEARKCRI